MLLIGLLILVAAAAFAGVLISENWGGGTFAIKGFGHVLGHYTLAQIFISGIVLTAIFFFGLWAASVSTRLRRRASGRRRAESRAAREEHDESRGGARPARPRTGGPARRDFGGASSRRAAGFGGPTSCPASRSRPASSGCSASQPPRVQRSARVCHRSAGASGARAASRVVPHPAGRAGRRPANARSRGLADRA